MANTSPIFVRVDEDVKNKSESILKQLGISMSSAFNMFLNQIILCNGLPFDVRLPREPIATGNMSEEQIEELIQDGVDSCKEGTFTKEEVDTYFEEKYDLKR